MRSEPDTHDGGVRPLRVAQAGIRGVPASYGGSETAVEEIGSRLAADGVRVVVYCRAHMSASPDREYRGMERVVLPSISTFRLDTVSHSLLASLHVLLRDTADVVHFHGMGNSLFLPLFRLSRKKVVVTIDGPDWERPKWGPLARGVLRLSARMAVRLADHLIIDNRPSVEYFRREFGVSDRHATYVPYGADLEPPTAIGELDALGLRPRGYLLFVGALVPDKGPDILVRAYRQVRGEMPLVLVGDSPFAPEYGARLREDAARDPRVRMLGYVYGDAYRQLVANAYAYVHPARKEGTSPALLQAMGYGNCVVTSSITEALEVAGDAALPFQQDDPDDLARKLEQVLADEELTTSMRERALARVRAEYDWDDVAAAHRRIYEQVLVERGCVRHADPEGAA
jgi:glycosyltransferase involved in cell wall biosynthesis